MSIDPGRLADGINSAWDQWGPWLILAAAIATAALVVYAIVKAIRSKQRSRIVDIVTALVVLAWTSEGLWEVARHRLDLPPAFASMTFFVFEAMMISSGIQAEEHRRRYGTPGRAGMFVWVIALAMAVVVGANAGSLVEGILRVLLPLLVAGRWWVGITAPRDSDTPEILARRADEEHRRAATWAITPRTLLVRLGWMRPRAQTTTEAEREYRLRRMVVHADRLQSDPDSLAGAWAARRLRRLARQASEGDVTDVVDQVSRAAGIETLIRAIGADTDPAEGDDTTPVAPHDERADRGGHDGADMPPWGHDITPAWPDIRGGHQGRTSPPDTGADTTRTGSLSGGGQDAGQGADMAAAEGADKAGRVLAILLHDPKLSRKAMADKLGLSDRTVRRDINDLKILHGIATGEDTDRQLVDVLLSGGGQARADTPVNGADMSAFLGGGQGADTSPARGGHQPPPGADIEADTTSGHGADNHPGQETS